MKYLFLVLAIFPACVHAQGLSSDWFSCTKVEIERRTQNPEVLNWIKENAIAVPDLKSASKVRYIGTDFKRHEMVRFKALVSFETNLKLEDLKAFLNKFDLSLIRFVPKNIDGNPGSACGIFTSTGVLFVHKNSDDGSENIEITETNPKEAMQALLKFMLPDWVRQFSSEKYVLGSFVDAPILSEIENAKQDKGI